MENDLFGEGTHLPGSHFPLKHDSMIVGGRVISNPFFGVTKYRELLDYLFGVGSNRANITK